MINTWILIANASEAYIYNLDHEQFLKGKIKLNLIEPHEHPASRKRDSELVSDRLGRYRASGGTGTAHGAFVPQTDPKDHEAEVFATELANRLQSHCNTHSFDKLVLIAPPQFLGMLNKHLDKQVSKLISDVIEKDYTKIPDLQLRKYMSQHFLKKE